MSSNNSIKSKLNLFIDNKYNALDLLPVKSRIQKALLILSSYAWWAVVIAQPFMIALVILFSMHHTGRIVIPYYDTILLIVNVFILIGCPLMFYYACFAKYSITCKETEIYMQIVQEDMERKQREQEAREREATNCFIADMESQDKEERGGACTSRD